MKNLNVATYGVEEMSELQMREVDGGIIWFVALAVAAVALSSCNNNRVTIEVSGHGSGNNVAVGDSIKQQ